MFEPTTESSMYRLGRAIGELYRFKERRIGRWRCFFRIVVDSDQWMDLCRSAGQTPSSQHFQILLVLEQGYEQAKSHVQANQYTEPTLRYPLTFLLIQYALHNLSRSRLCTAHNKELALLMEATVMSKGLVVGPHDRQRGQDDRDEGVGDGNRALATESLGQLCAEL